MLKFTDKKGRQLKKFETVKEAVDTYGEAWTLNHINRAWVIEQQNALRRGTSKSAKIREILVRAKSDEKLAQALRKLGIEI